jgi:outer membrane lipoprotein SlyB
MQAALLTSKTSSPRGWLYPLLIFAAISVIILSVLGAAAIAGWLPRAESTTGPVQYAERSADSRPGERKPVACADCGVVDSIVPVEVKGETTGVGMSAGGVTGVLVGNQIGNGNGNGVATVGGAAGGAYVGNEIEKQAKKFVHYKVRVRMPDGTYRTTYHSAAPGFAVGDKVKVSNGRVVKPG